MLYFGLGDKLLHESLANDNRFKNKSKSSILKHINIHPNCKAQYTIDDLRIVEELANEHVKVKKLQYDPAKRYERYIVHGWQRYIRGCALHEFASDHKMHHASFYAGYL